MHIHSTLLLALALKPRESKFQVRTAREVALAQFLTPTHCNATPAAKNLVAAAVMHRSNWHVLQ